MITLPPIVTHYDKRRQHVYRSVRYNSTGQKLDIWRPESLTEPAPVLVFIPGGGWVVGHRVGQGHALMSHLVEQGWICVAIDYRTSPLHRWPTHIHDVSAAIAWTRLNIDQYGGDPSFLAVAGASAGGHMASLVGLAWEWTIDYPVEAVVSLYGVYDWQYRGSVYHDGFVRLLEALVVGQLQSDSPEIFRDASPIEHVRPDAPPFLILHGTADWLTPVGGARRFNRALSAVSCSTVSYHEICGAGHAFDLFNAQSAIPVVEEIGSFLTDVRQARTLQEVS